MSWAFFVTLGSVMAAIAVALGAVGSHVVKHRLTDAMFDIYETAVRYQFYHAIGLFMVGFVALRIDSSIIRSAGMTMILGTILFSGSLYAYVAMENKSFVMVTPVGGVLLIGSWLCLAYGVGKTLL